MTTWLLKNPHTLPMVITLNRDGSVTAAFPALNVAVRIVHPDPWKARDLAILACAKAIVHYMEQEMKGDSHGQSRTPELTA